MIFTAPALLFALTAWQGWGGTFATIVVVDVGLLVFALAATGCAAWAAWRGRGGGRRSWLALAGGLGAWSVGQAIWCYSVVGQGSDQIPFPSAAAAAYLLFPIGACAALLFFPAGNSEQSRTTLILDGLIVASSLFVVSWVSVLGSVYRAGSDTPLVLALSLAYPVADLVIATMAIVVLTRARPGQRLTLGLLCIGVILMALSASAVSYLTALGTYRNGGATDVGWVAAFVACALAALSSTRDPPLEPVPVQTPSQARLWLPYIPLLLAVAVGLQRELPSLGSGPIPAAILVLVFALLARQFIVLAENRRLLLTVARQAFRDRLTGLANRALFLDRLEQALQRRRRRLIPIVVLCMDLDNFKTVNDRLGHPAGDELLIRVAERLTGCMRSTDTVARLGGDEFAALVEGSVEDALTAADRVLEAFTPPFVIDGVALSIRPSIGLTIATAEMSDTTTENLLKQADQAMYAAKRCGGGCLRSFTPDPVSGELDRRPGFDGPTQHTLVSGAGEAVTGPPSVRTVTNQGAAGPSTPGHRPSRPVRTKWVSPPDPSRCALGVAVGVGLIAAVLCGIAVGSSDREAGWTVLLEVLSDGLALTATLLVAARAWCVAAEHRAWWLIALGMASWCVGGVVALVGVPDGRSPSVADLLKLAFYPLVYAGLVLLLRARARRLPAEIWLDAVTAGLTLGALAAALAFSPIESVSGGTPAAVVVGLAYPVGDVLLLALAVGALAVPGWRAEQRWVLLVAGFTLFAVADTVYLFRSADGYVAGTWIDALPHAATVLVAAASWRASGRRRTVQRPGLVIWVPPLVCTAVAVGLLVLDHDARLPRLAVVLAALSLIAVAARFAVTFREVVVLADSHRQARTDDLTDLANRRAVVAALSAAYFDEVAGPDGHVSGRGPGLLLMDLDRFKEINDSFGRYVGDQLLCQVADRLSRSVRPGDLPARLGGDAFAVLLPAGADITDARALAGRVLEALRDPFHLEEVTVGVEARIGIALCPQHCANPEDLLQRAGVAMYRAKCTRRPIAVYDATEYQHSIEERQSVEELRTAIAGGELTCYYQPKVSACDGQVHSVEALVRWEHPRHGLLLPDQFLPQAEQSGLMRPLTTKVLELALGQARRWLDRGITLTVAVNLSVTNLLDVDLVADIDRLLNDFRLPADALILEITESVLMTDYLSARRVVEALQELGIGLSIDDYGTGWSSLAYLQDLAVDELKLDRIFVARLATDPRSVAIVRSTVELAHSLGASLVAEGVEDEDTLQALRRYGCDVTQGHYHGLPLPADQLDLRLIGRHG
ncbi:MULTISPECIES: bifunctional diguanylate cyclase/phosphodiesterase [unclassified Rhodococcus (in: high G+C Gram-positive bacteria)]|uniref:bifunctional diguanylate cyclase/phosphodiesterase n=1 Tax=unclassified Rhodococcus (in: high G+C Gram-positive bacteria) TaxID=192944 RepID=UPI0028970550|nr:MULTISPECIES: bifunctional diguanylate cyclase/phosphodiesterase [unclassified Rhodococcus (in: high G+C Gram-positive bacteria)]